MEVKGTLLVLFLALSGTCIGQEACVSCPTHDQVLPHPTDCASYVKCDSGVAHFIRCPHGRLFDAETLSCKRSTSRECLEHRGPELTSCGPGLFPNKNATRHTKDSGSLSTDGACAQDCTAYRNFVASPLVHSVCAAEASLCLDSHLSRGVSLGDEWVLVSRHNNLRQWLALGLEDSAALDHNLPTAANMMALMWNGELAKVAQALADTCSEYHDCEECRLITSRSYTVGQNAKWVWTTSAKRPDFGAVVEEWYRQVQHVSNEDWLTSYTNPDGVVISSFTQVVWAETYEVGCGWTAFDKGAWVSHIIICNYGGQGNIKGNPVYEFGEPQSGCAGGASSTLPGLCQPPDNSDPCAV